MSEEPPFEEEDATQVGDASTFALQYKEKLRYASARKQWFHWNGRRWIPLQDLEAFKYAIEFSKKVKQESLDPKFDFHKKQEAINRYKRVATYNHLAAILRLAPAVNGIAMSEDEFDQDPSLLNMEDSMRNLSTGEKTPQDPKALCTKMANVTYDPNALCPRWDQFMKEIFEGNQDLIDYVHRALGYSLTGFTSEQCWFFLYGAGANGKSTLLKTIQGLMGDYAEDTNITTFLQRNHDSIRSDLASLSGARFIAIAETGNYSKLDLGLVKQFSAGDPITARFLFGKEFSYRPTGKLWFHGNSKPAIKASDEGTWRRVRLIPFTIQIPTSAQDKNLDQKLKTEYPGILNRLLAGLKQFQELGSLQEPESVLAAIADYRESNDPLQAWITDCCQLSPNFMSLNLDLHHSFLEYQHSEGSTLDMHVKTFATFLEQKGFRKGPKTMRGIMRLGIQLKSETPPHAPRIDPEPRSAVDRARQLFEGQIVDPEIT